MKFTCVLLLILGVSTLATSYGNPTPKSCTECKVVVKAAATLARNGSALNETIAVLQADCDKIANASKIEDEICKGIAEGLGELLPWIVDQLDTLAWDNGALCAAFKQCEVPCCATKSAPEQLHLSFTTLPSEMAITWVTLDATATHTAQYGLSAAALTSSANGHNTTYTWASWIGQIHTSVMTQLTPGTTYYYRVGDAAGGWSSVFHFNTLEEGAGTTGKPLRVVFFGDMGYGPNSDVTIPTVSKMVEAGEVDFILHNGDISYADGDMRHWDVFFNKIQPIASQVPYMVSAGNHEFWFNFSSYKNRFYMPLAEDRENMYYSFDAGSLHVVVTDTEDIVDTAWMSPAQLKWLSWNLESVDRTTTPWVMTMGHRPLYCSNHNHQDCNSTFSHKLQHWAEDVYYKNHVDLVLQSHVHDYERTWPLYNNEPTAFNYSNPTAPVYIVNGAGGNREGNSMPAAESDWSPHPTDGNHAQTADVSFSYVSVEGGNFHFQQRAANGTVLDDWTITK